MAVVVGALVVVVVTGVVVVVVATVVVVISQQLGLRATGNQAEHAEIWVGPLIICRKMNDSK